MNGLAAHLQVKALRERCIVLEALVRLSVDLIPPAALNTQAGAELIAAIEKASIPEVRL